MGCCCYVSIANPISNNDQIIHHEVTTTTALDFEVPQAIYQQSPTLSQDEVHQLHYVPQLLTWLMAQHDHTPGSDWEPVTTLRHSQYWKTDSINHYVKVLVQWLNGEATWSHMDIWMQ